MLDHRIDMFIKPLNRLQISPRTRCQTLGRPTRCGADRGWACLLLQQGWREAACRSAGATARQDRPSTRDPSISSFYEVFQGEVFSASSGLGTWLMESTVGRGLK